MKSEGPLDGAGLYFLFALPISGGRLLHDHRRRPELRAVRVPPREVPVLAAEPVPVPREGPVLRAVPVQDVRLGPHAAAVREQRASAVQAQNAGSEQNAASEGPDAAAFAGLPAAEGDSLPAEHPERCRSSGGRSLQADACCWSERRGGFRYRDGQHCWGRQEHWGGSQRLDG